MSDQPEALFLADVIENDPQSKAHHDAAAACLRRLHAECDALRADAERWRFWREFMAHADLDAAIDAARAALKEANHE